MKKTKLITNLTKKYNLKDKQIITKAELQKISDNDNIELKDLIFILGCYYGILYKTEEKWTRININKIFTTKENIKLIKADLKYIKGYGERSYTKKEIEEICNEYEVNVEDFLTYINRYKTCYYENMEVMIKNKKGLWIGKSPYLSREFITKNFLSLKQKIEIISYKVDQIYNIGIKEELADFAINRTLKRGNIERNLSFDKDRIINKLLYRAKFDMIDYVIKYLKRFKGNIEVEDVTYYEQYDEKNSIQKWLYPIKFKLNQRIILEEIIRNIYNTTESRTVILKMIYKKLNIRKLDFYNELAEIQKLLLTFDKAKICSNGRVIINEQI